MQSKQERITHAVLPNERCRELEGRVNGYIMVKIHTK